MALSVKVNMYEWLNLLKRDKIVAYYILVLSGLLIILIIISLFETKYYSNTISIISSILASIISAIIIVYFSYTANIKIKMKPSFYNLYDEIYKNYEKLNNFINDGEVLKNKWLKGNLNQGYFHPDGHHWLDKEKPEYEDKRYAISRYTYRYLTLTAYPEIANRNYLSEIEILGGYQDKLSKIKSYYRECHKFCDKIQDLESEGNIWSDYIGILNRKGINESNLPNMKLINNQYWIDGKINIKKEECNNKIVEIIKSMENCQKKFLKRKIQPIFRISIKY